MNNVKKYKDFLYEFKEYYKMTDDEYDYFGSFDDDFHGLKNKIIWFPSSPKYNYILISKEDDDLSGENCYKLYLNNIEPIDDIHNFTIKNMNLIKKYINNIVDLDYFMENIIKLK
jgi:hypothetical protein